MSIERNIGSLAALHWIDHGECAPAVTDEDLMGRRIDADVVGIIAKIDTANRVVVFTLEQPHRTVSGIRDIERIRGFVITDALRLSQAGYSADELTIPQVDHSDAVVAELGHEQALSSEIDRHMIDPTGNMTQWNLGLEAE